jgi:hypothetical protein
MSTTTASGDTRVPSDTDYLTDVMAMLWPGGSSHDVTVVPSRNRPKLVVPWSPLRAAAGALRRNGEALPLRDGVRQQILLLSMRVGVGQRMLGERVRLATTAAAVDPSIETHLATILGQPVLVSFRIGPARANRKPVLRVLSNRGESLGFAKIGINPVTSRLVTAEAENLDLVTKAGLRTITTPHVLDASSWNGLDILVQSPLASAGGHRQPVPGQLAAAMVELSRVGQVSTSTVGESLWWARVLDNIGTTSGTSLPAALTQAVNRVGASVADVTLEFGAWHGDWARWNMAVTPDSLNVWDWERFESDVPVGFDALHFRFQDLKSQMPRDEAIRTLCRNAPDLLAPFDVPADLSPVVAALYLLDLAVRYAQDFRALDGATWGFEGSPMLPHLLNFLEDWSG